MNYNSFPREWVFRDRNDINEFGVKGQTLNALLFNRMQGLPMFRDEMDAQDCMRQCFNNAYYISILILKDDFPQLSIARYSSIAYGQRKWKFQSDVHALTLGIVCNLLKYCVNPPFNAANYIQQSFSDVVYNVNCIDLGPRQIFNHMVNEIDAKGCWVSFYDLSPRHIEEIIYSGNSLKRYLTIEGDVICEAVRALCCDDKQRLKLIERLLEPEKERYGFTDAKVCNTYRMLYELRSQITGEPLPNKMPFDNVASYAPPFDIIPPSYSEDSKRVKELESEVAKLRNKLIDANALLTKKQQLEEKVNNLEDQNTELLDKLKRAELGDGWYVGDDNYEKISLDEKFSQRERTVFFSTVLSLVLNKEYIILSNLATFIAEMCNDNDSKSIENLGIFLSKMQKPEAASANAKAAKRVCDLLKLILPKEFRNDKSLTINKIIDNMKLNFPEED